MAFTYETMLSVMITKAEYDYLKPAFNVNKFGFSLSEMNEQYFFIGEYKQIQDMKERLKGLIW